MSASESMSTGDARSDFAPGLDNTQAISRFRPRPSPIRLTPAQQVLGFLFRADAGEVRLSGLPERAEVRNIRILDVSYIERQAMAFLDVSWTTDGGKVFNKCSLKQVISIV